VGSGCAYHQPGQPEPQAATDTTGRTPADTVTMAIDSASAQEQDSLRFKSGYDDVAVSGGASSVDADLVDDDLAKNPLLRANLAARYLGGYYRLKRRLKTDHGLAIGLDYSFVNQFSSFSTTDRQAASGIFRVYGNWQVFGSKETTSGTVVYRFEHRHLIGSGITPRELGFDGGSSLSTVAFVNFGWGTTALYWKQRFDGERYRILVGQMDPGDFSDTYVLLTPFKSFVNDANFHNPTVALPQMGLGIVSRARLLEHWYVSGGLHDANGSPTQSGFDTFFNVREYYTWIETGWTPGAHALDGEGVHVNLWHQDAREDEGTDETWGVTFSANTVVHRGGRRWSPFFRAGYSEEDGGQLVRFMVSAGVGVFFRKSDLAGVATSWSGPPDRGLRNQWTTEAFYRLQFTEHLAVTPNIQFTVNPSQTLETDVLWVVTALRLRLAL
jgi:porin